MKKKKTENSKETSPKKTGIKKTGKKAESPKKGKLLPLLCGAAEVAIPAAFTVLCVFAYKLADAEKIRAGVMVFLLLLLTQFAKARSAAAGDYLYDNADNPFRFSLVFLSLYAVSCFFPLFTQHGWPFLCIALILTMLSNTLIGLSAYTAILTSCVLNAGAPAEIFVMYFISGMCVCVIFSAVDESFRIQIPMILSCAVYLTAVFANVIITQNANFAVEMVIIPVIGLFLNVILMLIFLRFINIRVVGRLKGRYMEINDPEYVLMAKIREADERYYYRAIHTAYLCNKAASRMGMDADAVRACGFYHEAGIVKGEDSKENLLAVVGDEYHLPQKVCDILEEYKTGKPLRNKETLVLTLSASLIEAITEIFEKDKKAKVNYREMIEKLFDAKAGNDLLKKCNITMEELFTFKKMLMEENLYYDFLR